MIYFCFGEALEMADSLVVSKKNGPCISYNDGKVPASVGLRKDKQIWDKGGGYAGPDLKTQS